MTDSMNAIKKFLTKIFIDGLSGMAMGLFATLIIGTILKQIGDLTGGPVGGYISSFALLAQRLTGAGIGVGVAYKFGEPAYVLLASAVSGMIGAYASGILAGTLVTAEGGLLLTGPGEPLGAFVAAYAGIAIGHFAAGRTKLDLLVTPALTLLSGGAAGLLVGPGVSRFMGWAGGMINWGTVQQPILMGIVVSVLMGMALTLPISSAALGVILGLNGIAAGAATVGCCCQMVGFAVTSWRDNGMGGLLAQGLGTSMIQMPNIIRHPLIWIPPTLASAILGPIAILGPFHMENNATGSGMGTSGLVGPIMTYQTMAAAEDPMLVLIKILVFQFLLPAVVSYGIYAGMRKIGFIRDGSMKLTV